MPGGMLIGIEDVASYLIQDGNRIVVDPAPGAEWANVRLFLLGSVMGVVLHQRGLLPLHANAIVIDGQACAFMGHSGAGKSTLAACFHDAGYPVLADDVVVVSFDERGEPIVSPGIPRVRLWEAAVVGSGRDPADYELSYAGDEKYRKFDVPLSTVAETDRPLKAIVILARGDVVSLEPMQGVHAVEALVANTYRGGYVPTLDQSKLHWESCLRLAKSTKVLRYVRPWSRDRMVGDLQLLINSIGGNTD
ncbi:hypothetical protein SH584_02045 [Sphingomonas sp. LY29]|uniref:hypothetical protein n=1 Tax=Sphingomonas sp. LY29 TaxID=3095341 RepID=UPI002D768994|nr:hypothetical protein [Sphingomonas sp. LY29]WRP26242.1 hypothetical protein SH584_02045 [Sphingomonas sp. LY29]